MNIKTTIKKNNREANKTVEFSKFQNTEVGKLDIKDVMEFLKDFPKNAVSWKDATDEVSTMGRWLIENLGEEHPQLQKPIKSRFSTPKEHNSFWVDLIKEAFQLLDAHKKKLFFSFFAHWFYKRLFESEGSGEEKTISEMKTVMEDNSKKFVTESGIFFEIIGSKRMAGTSMSLAHHAETTQDVDGFIASVSNVMSTLDEELTDFDKEKLAAHYVKYKR